MSRNIQYTKKFGLGQESIRLEGEKESEFILVTLENVFEGLCVWVTKQELEDLIKDLQGLLELSVSSLGGKSA